MDSPNVKPLNTIAYSAVVLGVPEATLRTMVRHGQIPVIRAGRKFFVSGRVLAEFLAPTHPDAK